ncbi:MAG: hypothetical protein ACRCUT_05185, partial [Spirochaetota bacterium]
GGIRYLPDAKTPYAQFSAAKDLIDYCRYPRETLNARSGDCDELTALYCSLLSHAGINTAILSVPGMLFAALDTGVPESRRPEISSDASRVIISGGTVWIPADLTLIGHSFDEAWRAAARQWNEHVAKKDAGFVRVSAAREMYPSAMTDDIPGAVKP